MPRNLTERFRSMYLLKLLLVSLTIAFTYGDPRMMTPVFQAVNFAREIRGRRLNGSVIREIQVDSESSCRLHCVKESSCVSYNFGSTINNKKFKCQLSDSDRFASFKNFSFDWFHINVRDKHLQHTKNVFNYLNFCKIYSFQRKQSMCMLYEQAYYDWKIFHLWGH